MKKIHKFQKDFCDKILNNLSSFEMGAMQFRRDPITNLDIKTIPHQPSNADIWEVNELAIIDEVKNKISNEIPLIDHFECNVLRLDNSKKNEEHIDTTDYTAILLLNDKFNGGNLIVKKQNMELEIGDLCYFPSSYKHYVEPVIDGERYTLVLFVTLGSKVKKTLL
jgi:hypothetical protein